MTISLNGNISLFRMSIEYRSFGQRKCFRDFEELFKGPGQLATDPQMRVMSGREVCGIVPWAGAEASSSCASSNLHVTSQVEFPPGAPLP